MHLGQWMIVRKQWESELDAVICIYLIPREDKGTNSSVMIVGQGMGHLLPLYKRDTKSLCLISFQMFNCNNSNNCTHCLINKQIKLLTYLTLVSEEIFPGQPQKQQDRRKSGRENETKKIIKHQNEIEVLIALRGWQQQQQQQQRRPRWSIECSAPTATTGLQ